jgi:hypothetical protein
MQRRLYDYPCAPPTTPTALEQRPQRFLTPYTTTAPYGVWHAGLTPPSPMRVLGAAQGRLDAPDERARQFSQALFPRTPPP